MKEAVKQLPFLVSPIASSYICRQCAWYTSDFPKDGQVGFNSDFQILKSGKQPAWNSRACQSRVRLYLFSKAAFKIRALIWPRCEHCFSGLYQAWTWSRPVGHPLPSSKKITQCVDPHARRRGLSGFHEGMRGLHARCNNTRISRALAPCMLLTSLKRAPTWLCNDAFCSVLLF